MATYTPMRFSENFWSAEITGTEGFDVLVKHMKDGQRACGDFESFVRERVKIEDTYQSSLMKLAKTQFHTLQEGILGQMFLALKESVRKVALAHEKLRDDLTAQAEDLHQHKDYMKSVAKRYEAIVKELQNSKANLYEKTVSAGQLYKKKYQQHENADKKFKASKTSIVQSKDSNKLEKQMNKAAQEMSSADDVYKNYVNDLKRHCIMWEKEMRDLCNTFQQLDEDRIILMRKAFWIHTNYVTVALLDHDNAYDSARDTIEKLDPLKDVKEFIERNRTRQSPAVHLEYESCDKPGSAQTASITSASNGNSQFYSPSSPAFNDEINDPTYSSVDF